MKQERRERADDEHHWQRAKREDEALAGLGLGKRQFGAAEIAKDKTGAGLGRLLQRLDRLVQHKKHGGRRREFQKQEREGELQQDARDDDPPGHRSEEHTSELQS